MVINLVPLVPPVPTARQMHRAPCALRHRQDRQDHQVLADPWVRQMVVVIQATGLPRKSVEGRLVSETRSITEIT